MVLIENISNHLLNYQTRKCIESFSFSSEEFNVASALLRSPILQDQTFFPTTEKYHMPTTI